ncbi:hypothetical protein NCCP2140_18320 [Pseudoalteromonas sp. NCCP-2140]|nr:hypothetical protein NCCP2140_18320 [Pseudoalteromonas sp. NCCP-2140]
MLRIYYSVLRTNSAVLRSNLSENQGGKACEKMHKIDKKVDLVNTICFSIKLS